MMNYKLLLAGTIACTSIIGKTQAQVHWEYSYEKIANDIFDIHLTATIQAGWHVYSQVQPSNAIATPSKITFAPNSLVALEGKVKEIGKKELFEDKTIGISSLQYKAYVDFVQRVRMRRPQNTRINGTITFMPCSQEQCLPATSQEFSIQIQ